MSSAPHCRPLMSRQHFLLKNSEKRTFPVPTNLWQPPRPKDKGSSRPRSDRINHDALEPLLDDSEPSSPTPSDTDTTPPPSPSTRANDPTHPTRILRHSLLLPLDVIPPATLRRHDSRHPPTKPTHPRAGSSVRLSISIPPLHQKDFNSPPPPLSKRTRTLPKHSTRPSVPPPSNPPSTTPSPLQQQDGISIPRADVEYRHLRPGLQQAPPSSSYPFRFQCLPHLPTRPTSRPLTLERTQETFHEEYREALR